MDRASEIDWIAITLQNRVAELDGFITQFNNTIESAEKEIAKANRAWGAATIERQALVDFLARNK
jgi:flagellar biosynthesis chaperone FliJ